MWGSQFDVLLSSHHTDNWLCVLYAYNDVFRAWVHLSLLAARCQIILWCKHNYTKLLSCITVESGPPQIGLIESSKTFRRTHVSVIPHRYVNVTRGAVVSEPGRWPPAGHWPGDRVWSFTQWGETFPSPLPALESWRLPTLTPEQTQSQKSL